MALSITLTELRLETYWDALSDLPIDAVVYACRHAARWWSPPESGGRFPMPAVLREYACQYLAQQRQRLLEQQTRMLPQWGGVSDDVALKTIHAILDMLDQKADMRERLPDKAFSMSDDPLHYEPTVDPKEARAKLREQFRQLREQEEEGAS